MEKGKVKSIHISNSEKDTLQFAEGLAKKLEAGNLLALYGNLGAGKTTFIKGLAKGLGYKERVLSPTFIFIRSYKIRGSFEFLHHIDLYRAQDTNDLKTIGVEEFLTDQNSISAIEWPEKIETHLPKQTIKITLESLGENKRKITVY